MADGRGRMEAFTRTGRWWVPTDPERTVFGTLEFSPDDGTSLKLSGAFVDEIGPDASFSTPIIVGVANDGTPITLTEAQCIHREMGFGAEGARCLEEYHCRRAFLGHRFGSPDDLTFPIARVEFSRLADWVARSGFTVDLDGRVVRVSYSHPEPLRAAVPGAVIKLTTNMLQNSKLGEISMLETVALEITTDTPLEVDEWERRFLRPLQNLVTLVTDGSNRTVSARFRVPSDDPNEPPAIEVHMFRGPAIARSDERRGEPLCHLSDIAEDFEAVVGNWLQVREELRSVCNAYFAVRQAPFSYTNDRFLTAVYAVEQYHRRRFPGEDIPKTEHKKRLGAILEAAPAGQKKWLREKLAWSNERSLASRLTELLTLHPLVTAGPTEKAEIADGATFVQQVVRTRNHMVHGSERKGVAKTGAGMARLAEVLLLILESCLLGEIGIADDRQASWFSQSNRYPFV
jgi:hypothetical protein